MAPQSPKPAKADHQTFTMAISSDNDNATETSPLLSPTPTTQDQGHHIDFNPRHHILKSQAVILNIILLAVVFASFGDQLQESPVTRIYESVICYNYYSKHDPTKLRLPPSAVGPGAIGGVDEMWCKADPVQDELAMLNGFQLFLDGIPGLILAIPFGWLADRYGRWSIVMLNLSQIALRTSWIQIVAWNWQVFNVKAMWYQSALSIMGGGASVLSSLAFVMVADISQPEERATNFLRLSAFNLSATLLMPPLASWLMQKNPWIPSIIGLALQVLGVIAFLFVPETLDHLSKVASNAGEPVISPEPSKPSTTTTTSSTNTDPLLNRAWTNIKRTLHFLTSDWRVPVLIVPFITHLLIGSNGRLLLQYISKRYGMTYSKATIIMTVGNGVQTTLMFIILPWVSRKVMEVYGLSSQKKDLYLARASQILVAVGWLGIAASPNVATLILSLTASSLGLGAMILIRSFISSIVPAHETARTYSVMSVVDTLGMMFGSPLLADLFKHGMKLGGGFIGLPFYFLGMLSASFVVIFFIVRLKKGEGKEARTDVEGEGERVGQD